MKYVLFSDTKPFGKLILTFFLMASSYLIIFIITALAAIPIFRITIGEIIEIFRTGDFADHINMISFFQVTYSTGLFLIPALLAGFLFYGDSLEYIYAKKMPVLLILVLSVLVVLVSLPLINFLAEFNMNLSLPEKLSALEEQIRETEKTAEELMNIFLSDTTTGRFLINLLMIAIVPAIGEEFFFRGVLQRIFTEWFRNHHMAVIIAAILFSFMHFQFLGFIPRILLGILFGYMLVWSGSIWVPVFAHFINNSIGVTYYFLYNRDLIGEDLDTIGSDKGTIIYTIFSIILLIILMGSIYIAGKRKINRSRA